MTSTVLIVLDYLPTQPHPTPTSPIHCGQAQQGSEVVNFLFQISFYHLIHPVNENEHLECIMLLKGSLLYFFSFFSIVFMYNYSGISKSSPGFLEELYNNRESQAPVLANWFKSLGGGSNPVRDLNQPLDNSSVHWSLKKLQKKLGKCWNLDFVDCGNLSEVDLEWSCLWKLPGLYFHSDLMTFMDQFVVCRMWKQ